MDLLTLLLAFTLVALNAFFVATEFALVKIRPTRIEEMIRKQRPGASAVRLVVGNLDAYLSATQLGITLASLGLGWVGEPAFARLLAPLLQAAGVNDPDWVHRIALVAAFFLISFLHIVAGELAPKSIAIRRAESVALAVALPMRLFYLLFFPAIWALNGLSNALLRITGVKAAGDNEHHSEEEIKIILSQARSAGLLSASRSDLMRKVLTLPTKTARHLMVPRNEVVCLDINLSTAENLQRARTAAHTRFPLCDRELDDVIGVVDIREALHGLRDGDIDLRSLARPAPYFPELMSAERLLAEFRARHATMAVVVDEYGGASGIVTPADVVSAVMGDIAEDNELEVVALPGGAYDVDGVAPLEEIEETLKLSLGADNMRTVAGFLMERLGRMPRAGDRVVHTGYVFTIVEVAGPRVRKVRIARESTLPRPPPAAPAAKDSGRP
ncbi:MAG: HlyC/CorC family transporter [Deltaproteobacteria bacterium]|nr:MAG: HlyC/CorC family transporter [Deltaproteobacteria bacterium]